MEDKLSPVLSNIEYNINLYEDTDLYNTMADRILAATDYYTKDSGLVICNDKSEAEVAKNILEKDYTVEIKPLGDSEYDLQYHVMFERPFEEEYKDLKFMTNKGTPGTLVGEVGGVMGEDYSPEDNRKLYNIQKEICYLTKKFSPMTDEEREQLYALEKAQKMIHAKYHEELEEDYENPEEELECPYCGGLLRYDSGQGSYEMYRCEDCHDWVFLTKDNEFKSEDEVADDFITEANGNDSFEAAQAYYDSLITDEQQATLNNLKYELEGLGIDKVEVEQLIPTQDSEYNVTINCLIKDPAASLEEYTNYIEDVLSGYNATNIDLNPVDLNSPKYKFKIWGFCTIDGMTLHESEEVEEEVVDEAEIHDTLNPDLWENEELKPEVKDKLFEIADKFKQNLEENDIKLDVKDIVIVGSNTQYNYTDKSDIDLHLLVDLSVYPNQEELAAKLYDARKSLWNDKYDPTIYGHPVEIYVEPYVGE